MNEENVVVDTTETATEETVASETTEESVEDVRVRLTKAEELANNYKVRAEKAEKKIKETVTVTEPKKDDLSNADLYDLFDAKVKKEDVSDVVEFAKFRKISIAEALKSPVVKTLLKDKEESRRVADATNTGTSRRSNTQPTDDERIEKAVKGDLPESDVEVGKLAQARWNRLKARK